MLLMHILLKFDYQSHFLGEIFVFRKLFYYLCSNHCVSPTTLVLHV